MGQIKLKNIRVFAHHGCLPEETKIGSDYRVDLKVTTDLKRSASSDNLTDTVDYVFLNHVVREEMAIPAKLLETVAQRILYKVINGASTVTKATVWVSKINPPIGGDVAQVTIKMTQTRKNKR